MISYSTTTEIKASVEQVYALLSDETKVNLWLKGLAKLETVNGTPGQVGFQGKYTFVENNRTVIFYEEITAVEPGRSFSTRMQSDGLTMEGHTTLEGLGGSTRLTVRQSVKGKSFFMKLMMPFLKGMMRKRQEEDFRRFKQFVEGGIQALDTNAIKGGAIPWVDQDLG